MRKKLGVLWIGSAYSIQQAWMNLGVLILGKKAMGEAFISIMETAPVQRMAVRTGTAAAVQNMSQAASRAIATENQQ